MGVLHSSFLPEHHDTQGMTQNIFHLFSIYSELEKLLVELDKTPYCDVKKIIK